MRGCAHQTPVVVACRTHSASTPYLAMFCVIKVHIASQAALDALVRGGYPLHLPITPAAMQVVLSYPPIEAMGSVEGLWSIPDERLSPDQRQRLLQAPREAKEYRLQSSHHSSGSTQHLKGLFALQVLVHWFRHGAGCSYRTKDVTKGFLSCPLFVDANKCNCDRRRTNLDHWNEELMKCDAGTSTVGAALRRAVTGTPGGKKLPRWGFSGSRPYSGPWSDRTIRRAKSLVDRRQRFQMSSAVDAKSLTKWDWPLAKTTLLALNGGVKDGVCRRFDRAGGEVVEALRCCHLALLQSDAADLCTWLQAHPQIRNGQWRLQLSEAQWFEAVFSTSMGSAKGRTKSMKYIASAESAASGALYPAKVAHIALRAWVRAHQERVLSSCSATASSASTAAPPSPAVPDLSTDNWH